MRKKGIHTNTSLTGAFRVGKHQGHPNRMLSKPSLRYQVGQGGERLGLGRWGVTGTRVRATGNLSDRSDAAWSLLPRCKPEVSSCLGVKARRASPSLGITGRHAASPEFQAMQGSKRLRIPTVAAMRRVGGGIKRKQRGPSASTR